MKMSILAAVLLLAAAESRGDIRVREDIAGPTLSNSRLTIALSRHYKGGAVALADHSAAANVTWPQAPPELFQLVCSDPGDRSGKTKYLSSNSAESVAYALERRGDTAFVRITYRRIQGLDLGATCTVSVSARDDLLRWSMRVDGSGSLVLEQAHFPILGLRVPLPGSNKDGTQDAVVAGLTKGGVYRHPAAWPKGRGVGGAQPGNLCAQFGCYYGPFVGLYSATQDRLGYPKYLEVRRVEQGLRWAWRRVDYHRLDKPFRIGYPIVMTTLAGKVSWAATAPGRGPAPRALIRAVDWRDGADIYKQWAVKQPWCATRYADRPDVPDWLKQGPAMVRFHRRWLSRPERVEAWLDQYWKDHFPQAPLIVAFWGWEHVASWISPKYFPPYPSEEGFARCVRSVRAVSGHPFLWPSGYHWNVTYGEREDGGFEWDDRADFQRAGAAHAAAKRDGSVLLVKRRWLRGGQNALICRGDPWGRQWLDDIGARIVKRGVDMVQVDQVVGGRSSGRGECWSTDHGHPPGPGLWFTQTFAQQLQSLLRVCRQTDPAAVLGCEEPQELFNHLVAIQDYRDRQVREKPRLPGHVPASVFGYLYHEYLPCFQSNPRAGDRVGLAYCLVTGQIPHWTPHWPITPSPALVAGGFELWSDDKPEGWGQVKAYKGQQWRGEAHRDDAVQRSGRFSLRLDNHGADDVVQVSQNVVIGPGCLVAGRPYRLRLWYKAEAVAAGNAVRAAALGKPNFSRPEWAIHLKQSDHWLEGTMPFVVPQAVWAMRFMLHLRGPCRVWFDDAVLEERLDDGSWTPLLRSGLPAEHEFVQQWVKLFHGEGRPYLHLGRMLRPPMLLSPTEVSPAHAPFAAVMLNAFEARDGSKAAIAVNVTDATQQARFEWLGRTHDATLEPWQPRLIRP